MDLVIDGIMSIFACVGNVFDDSVYIVLIAGGMYVFIIICVVKCLIFSKVSVQLFPTFIIKEITHASPCNLNVCTNVPFACSLLYPSHI